MTSLLSLLLLPISLSFLLSVCVCFLCFRRVSNPCHKSLVYVMLCVCVHARVCVLNGLAGLFVIMSCSMVSICRGRLHVKKLSCKKHQRKSTRIAAFRRKAPLWGVDVKGPARSTHRSCLTDESVCWLEFFFQNCDLGPSELLLYGSKLNQMRLSFVHWCTFQREDTETQEPKLTVIWFYIILK